MNTQTMARELTEQATKMERDAEAMRKAAAILAPTNGKRRGRPPGSKNRPKVNKRREPNPAAQSD